MEKVTLAHENLTAALNKLEEAIGHFSGFKESSDKNVLGFMNDEDLKESLRDSLIQRFEFCTDLFWKYLKKYLEIVVENPPEVNGPSPVIKAACKAKLLSEADTENLLEMIKSRNLTSHTYREDIAEQISLNIPGFFKIMKKYAEILKA